MFAREPHPQDPGASVMSAWSLELKTESLRAPSGPCSMQRLQSEAREAISEPLWAESL